MTLQRVSFKKVREHKPRLTAPYIPGKHSEKYWTEEENQTVRWAVVIHYHGLPITPSTAAVSAISGGHAFVSFHHPEQLSLAMEVCQSFAVDNGAFSAWKSGEPVSDWKPYYAWVREMHRHPAFDFAVIPDVIDGDESANDTLLDEWPWGGKNAWIGAPVWHLHESLDRLARLAEHWPRVCLGSSGEYAVIGNAEWWQRMGEAMSVVCDADGILGESKGEEAATSRFCRKLSRVP